MNTKKQGDIGLGNAIAYFTSIGATVSIPLTDSQDYDLVVDIAGVLNRVQVKHCTHKPRKNYCVGLSVKGGNKSGLQKIKKFSKDMAEFLFICTPDGSYLIPCSELTVTNAVTLCQKYDRFRLNW